MFLPRKGSAHLPGKSLLGGVFLKSTESLLYFHEKSGPIVEKTANACNFSEKGQKRAKYLKIWQKCTKFENILKTVSLVRATIACMKQLVYALEIDVKRGGVFQKLYKSFIKKALL